MVGTNVLASLHAASLLHLLLLAIGYGAIVFFRIATKACRRLPQEWPHGHVALDAVFFRMWT